MNTQVEELNRLSLSEFPGLYASLKPPEAGSLRGLFKGSFVGPAWLRRLAKPLLIITGMGDWWGKEFDPQGKVVNLVWRKGEIERRLPMFVVEQASYIDQGPSLIVNYAADNPFPWPWIVDELRIIRQDLLLGMTIARPRPLRRLPLPFLLQPRDTIDGL